MPLDFKVINDIVKFNVHINKKIEMSILKTVNNNF